MDERSGRILVSGISGAVANPITIENCTVASDGGIGIYHASGAVDIRQVPLTGGGELLTEVSGAVSLQDTAIDGSTAYGGVYAIRSDTVSVTGGSISASSPGAAMYAIQSRVACPRLTSPWVSPCREKTLRASCPRARRDRVARTS